MLSSSVGQCIITRVLTLAVGWRGWFSSPWRDSPGPGPGCGLAGSCLTRSDCGAG